MSNTVVVPSTDVNESCVTVLVCVTKVGVVMVEVAVTKVSPTVRVMEVLREVVLTVVGVGLKKVTEPVNTVGLVTVILVGLVMVGEKAVTVEKTTVDTEELVNVIIEVRVTLPVTVVTSSMLKMNGFSTVNIRKDVIRLVEG
jgi:hypothetical protein